MGHFSLRMDKFLALISSIALAKSMGLNEGDGSGNRNVDGQLGNWENKDMQKGPIGGWDDDGGNSFLKGASFPGQGQPGAKDEGGMEARIPGIPGIPGQSYPRYNDIPQTSFDCKRFSNPGYYGDIETRCQVFHICQADGRQSSFLCPVGTMFNQQVFVCDWWYNVNCPDSPFHYDLNRNLYNERPQNNGNKGMGINHDWNNVGIMDSRNSPNWPNSANQKGQTDQSTNQWNRKEDNIQNDWHQMDQNSNLQDYHDKGHWNINNQKIIPDIHEELQVQKGINVHSLNINKNIDRSQRTSFPERTALDGPGQDNLGGLQGSGKFRNQRKSNGGRIKRRRKVRKPMKNKSLGGGGHVTSRISRSSWSQEKKSSGLPSLSQRSNQVGHSKEKSWNQPSQSEYGHKQSVSNVSPTDANIQSFGVWKVQEEILGQLQNWKNNPQMKDPNWNKDHSNNQQVLEFQKHQGLGNDFIPLLFINLYEDDPKNNHHGNRKEQGGSSPANNLVKGHNKPPNWK